MQYLTVREAAQILRIAEKTLRRAIRAGRIPGARRVPGCRRYLIPKSFVEARTGDNAA